MKSIILCLLLAVVIQGASLAKEDKGDVVLRREKREGQEDDPELEPEGGHRDDHHGYRVEDMDWLDDGGMSKHGGGININLEAKQVLIVGASGMSGDRKGEGYPMEEGDGEVDRDSRRDGDVTK